MSFPCIACGLCCRSINKKLMPELYTTGSTCQYLDPTKNTCKIYAIRPDICRVDESWERGYSQACTRQEFYRINLRACIKLATQAERMDLVSELRRIQKEMEKE